MLNFIAAQPLGFETPVGADGIRISGEMVQRLALARAILRKPSILLLDEISSALDPAEEVALNRTLAQLAKTTTLISVTHRLASTAAASHIFVFDRGQMVEQGSHFELIAMQGTYANLWRKQAGFRYSADGQHVDVDAQRLGGTILEKLPEADADRTRAVPLPPKHSRSAAKSFARAIPAISSTSSRAARWRCGERRNSQAGACA